ncbi:lipoprotein [Burkholderia sp. A9]|uniref:XdhC family protein n=1 Tax=Burkholderia sp. A9 TaxID=1365108 RepID=UPI000573E0B5|nr:XdhC family protein [Burkholderia sp. A9]KHK59066.1 lipoprotein [Burkholderia sp. A9]
MDSVDVEVLTTALDWWRAGASVVLATVVHTWGSAPRPVGSILAIRRDGAMKGSVSGGCIEDDLAHRVRSGALMLERPETLTYGVTADEAHRFGLPCGGTLELVVEPLTEALKLAEVLAATMNGEAVRRTLDVVTGEATFRHASEPAGTSFDGRILEAMHGPRLRLVLIGAGQLSEYVARMALPLGYAVTVCDPREEYMATWCVERTEFSREMPDDLLIRIGVNSSTAIVALTHDPKLDDMALLEALKSDAFYVGAIGSRANCARRRERVGLFDLTADQIDRLHAPVGLHIGAQTPPEIAVAIVAEMTAIRRDVPVLQSHAMRAERQLGEAATTA